MLDIFPWFSNTWQLLVSYKKQQRIPSGMMFSGQSGIGKSSLVQRYAKYILCKQIADESCGICNSCLLFDAGSHPDYMKIQPEEGSSLIKVEQIRNLVEVLEQTSGLGGYQVAAISKAEDMNKSAANALLKTLEEPPGKVLIIILSDRPAALLATIRSRCQQIKLGIPSKESVRQWLSQQMPCDLADIYLGMADNLPLKALYYIKADKISLRNFLITSLQQISSGQIDPINVAVECLEQPEEIFNFLTILVMDMIRIKFSSKKYVNNHDKIMELKQICDRLSFDKLFYFLDVILKSIQALANRNNVNLQLSMEKIFISWRYNNDLS